MAEKLACALEASASAGGLIPEQIWDVPDIPERELYFGRPSGSAMPLVWAHAEYIKLRRSLRDGRVFDMPTQPVQRYQVERIGSPYTVWRVNQKCRAMRVGNLLRLQVSAPAMAHWSVDGWQSAQDVQTRDTGLGVHVIDLPTDKLAKGSKISFTFHSLEDKRWESVNYAVEVE